jgi:hypothetical protein
MVVWNRKKIKTSHNSRWYPAGESKSGHTKYYYKLRGVGGRGGGGGLRYSKRQFKDFTDMEKADSEGNPVSLVWKSLKRAWNAWNISLYYSDYDKMEFYAAVIQSLQDKLEIPITHFPILEGGEDAQNSYYKAHRFAKSSKFLNKKDY